jgi:hypothetical protein
VSRDSVGDPYAAGLAEAELDRLADHLAGALEQADSDEVDRLIAEDPRWAAATEALADADAAVRAALAGADGVGPMPDDIAARLDDALRDLARTPALATVSSLSEARARRRRLLTNITMAAAALVAVVGGVTIAANLSGTRNATTTTNSAGDSVGAGAGSGAANPAAASPVGPNLIASGTNYTLSTLGGLSAVRPESDTAKAPAAANGFSSPMASQAEVGQVPPTVRERAPTTLVRLLDPVALSACLDAIVAGTQGVVVTVDYALFSGEPALVVLVREGASSTAVAVGPRCGLGGADQKGLASVP